LVPGKPPNEIFNPLPAPTTDDSVPAARCAEHSALFYVSITDITVPPTTDAG